MDHHGLGTIVRLIHDKDFWFKQIWVDLLQTMVLDRQRIYTRPVIRLARCVCKDEHGQRSIQPDQNAYL